MPNVTVGSILTVDKGRYTGDAVSEAVVITNVAATTVSGSTYAWTVTLQNAFTSTYRNGFVITQTTAYASPYYFIYAVDATKKILTVLGDWASNPETANFGVSAYSAGQNGAPVVGNSIITTVNILKTYQWFRDGTAISANANAPVYSVQNADIGTNLTVKETAFYWDTQSSVTTTSSANVTIIGSALADPLVRSDNVTYVGSFALTDQIDGTQLYVGPDGKGMSIGSYGGQSTLYIGTRTKLAEYSIPALVNLVANSSYTISNLNLAPFARSQSTSPNRKFFDPTEGAINSIGSQGNNGYLEVFGTTPISSTSLLVCGTNTYTYATNTAMWTRPVDLTTTGSVSSAFFVNDVSASSANNPRWFSGYVCKIPSTIVGGKNYQSLLGGDLLSGAYTLSVDVNESRGPSAIVWNSSDIASTVPSKAISGTITSVSAGGAANEYLLGLGSGVTFDPTNYYLSITGGSGRLQTVKVKSWNSGTFVATVSRADANATIFPSVNVIGVTLASPVVVSLTDAPSLYDANNGFAGFGVRISGIVGTTQLNNNIYYCKKTSNFSVELYSDASCTTPINGTAFSAWVSGGAVNVIPTTASTYTLIPRINGTQVLGHTEYIQQRSAFVVQGVQSAATGMVGHFIPSGTRSLMFVGSSGDGEYTYSPGAFGFGSSGVGTGPLVYDTGEDSAGPHTWPWSTRVICYDLDELVSVKNGTRNGGAFAAWDGAHNATNQLKPYAVFKLDMPLALNTQFVISACCYDSTTRRMYVMGVGSQSGPGYGRCIIHVYEISNAVAA